MSQHEQKPYEKLRSMERRPALLEWRMETGECLGIMCVFRREGKAPWAWNLGFPLSSQSAPDLTSSSKSTWEARDAAPFLDTTRGQYDPTTGNFLVL